MKKQLSLILILCLLLSGCSAASDMQSETTGESTSALIPTETETIPEETATDPTEEPEETVLPETEPEEMLPPETEPAETTPEETVPPETTPPETKPQQTTTPQSKPQQTPTTGNNTKPTVSTPTTQKPTVSVPPVEETPKGEIYFEQSSITIQEGENMLLRVKGDIWGEYVTYTSSDTNIVTASGGFLLAVNPGTAVVTATHYGRTATVTVHVTPDPSIIRINAPDEITIYVRHAAKLDVRYNGDQTLKYDSYDESIACVDRFGTVYGVSPGVCKIFVSDRSRGQYCTVTVLPDPNWKPTSEIKTDNFSAPLYDGVVMEVGDIMTFRAWNVPEESYDGILVDIDNYNCVQTDWTEDSDGTYTIHLQCAEPGTATLTLTSEDGNASLSYTITVVKKQNKS